uniref:Glycosyltransferase family 92 protein n=1 Tax=Caenorhabditis tropicalis TaxID=1561998 RepID=A0A1I7TW07_9PELO
MQIPFKIPPSTKREVVMCISPVFVSEQWQNFLLAAHVYKQQLIQKTSVQETASFIGLMDLNDILIPAIAPNYVEEFQKLIKKHEKTAPVAYIEYERQHYEATVFNNTGFSLKDMMKGLVDKKKRSLGKIVLIPERINYTYIDRPTYLPSRLDYLNVEENTITYLETIVWVYYHFESAEYAFFRRMMTR